MAINVDAHRKQIAAYNSGSKEPELTPADLENRKHNKAMYKKIKIKDAAENLNMHLPEICAFGKRNKLTFGDALNYMIETTPGREPDPDIKRNLFFRSGIKLEADKDGSSAPINMILDDYALAFLMTEYQHDVFFENMHDDKFWAVSPTNHLKKDATKALGFAPAITRAQASDNTSNIQTVNPLELSNPLVTDLMVGDIIGERTVIRNNRLMIPTLKSPDEFKEKGSGLTGIGELADIPVWEMTTGERLVITNKAGFGVMSSYESMRTTELYIQQMTQFTEWLRLYVQQALVNEGLNVLIGPATNYDGDNTFTWNTNGRALAPQEVIWTILSAKFGPRRKGFEWNFGVGGRWFIAKWLGADLMMQSSTPFTNLVPGSRSAVDQYRSSIPVALRESDEIPAVANQNTGFFFDRRYCLRYVMERNSTIEETERKMSNQSITTYNTFSYAWDRMEPLVYNAADATAGLPIYRFIYN